MVKKLLPTLLVLSSFSAFSNQSDYLPYVLKKGDNVSEVIARYNLAPLYGKDEWVSKVLKLNRLTETSAKKMEVGDVIVLPLKATIFRDKEYKDEVKSLRSAVQKQTIADIKAKYLKDKEDNLKIGAEYFHQTWNFQTDNVNIQQNFLGFVDYQKRNVEKTKGFVFEPGVRLGFYTQSQADFASSSSLNADFTPSYFGALKFEMRNKTHNYSLAPIIQYEAFSALTYDSEDYQVTDNQLVWSGAQLSKYFNKGSNTFYLKAAYFVGNDLNATRAVNRFGFMYKKHYQFEFTITTQEMELGETVAIQNNGFNFAYQF